MKNFDRPLSVSHLLASMVCIGLLLTLLPINVVAGEKGIGSKTAVTAAKVAVDTPATMAARKKMITDQILARNITDEKVLQAMNSVPRHFFVPDDRKDDAYKDYPLAIGFGQTISQPYMVAYMSQIADIQPNERVLEVGSGSGYHGSVMSRCAKEVFSIEIVPGLAERSQKTVETLGYTNLTIRQGDGYFGWPEKAPFDAIVVTAASEHVPPPLIQQLAEGGRMIIPVGHPFVTQMLVMIEKKDGKITSKELMPVNFVPLTGNRPK
jgi:protein-L-isoaspartate(D-aspartate) O-methyltransferase